MQDLSKFNLKINVIPKGLSFSVIEKLSFIDSFYFLSSSLGSLSKLNKVGFKYLSQEFDNNLLDLQSFTRYFRLTPVFVTNSALREKFNFCFSRVF